jgi:signal transduction histidine kinase
MAIVKSNSERLNNLINDMLELTTIEAGKVNLTIHPTDIFELAQDVLARFRIRSEKENKAIEFYLETDSSIPLVLADPERAKQILENLVNNAYTFTETEGKITISLKNYQDGLQVNISDTGIGITKEQKEQIFDHFSWADNPSPQTLQGVGLGLPIVKQLVELQNGRIWVESSGIPGEGSTFSFTLPSQVS